MTGDDGATAIIMGLYGARISARATVVTDNPVEVNSIFIGLMMNICFSRYLRLLVYETVCTCDGCTTKSISTHYLCVV